MSRVPLLTHEDAHAAAERIDLSAQMAALNVFRVLLRRPKLARAVNDLLMSLLAGEALDTRLRELIIMRIGWVTGSDYEWTQHWRVARLLGICDEDLLAVRDWEACSNLSAADKAVLAATDEVLRDGAVAPDTFARCREHLGSDDASIELVAAIGTWRMIATVLQSLDVPLESGVESWPPDGAAGGAR